MALTVAVDIVSCFIDAMAKFAPSILGADFSRLGKEIADTDRLGVDMLHLDIMDGHFVPNISFGPGIVKTIDRLTDRFLDVHLMLSQPENYFEAFAEAGADAITFHIEVHSDPTALAQHLKEMGVKPGISLNPDTKIDLVLPFLHEFEFLLVMSVFPGFGGQKFIGTALSSIEMAREYINMNNLKTEIIVDGGIDGNNAAQVVAAGADILVMGSGFFGCDDRTELVKNVKAL